MRNVLAYTAYLRVYEPLESFPEPAHRRWAEYVARADHDRQAAMEREHQIGLAGTLSVPARPIPEEDPDEAYILTAGGSSYVCPWRLRPRCLQALVRFGEGLPEEIVDAFVPHGLVEQSADELARWQATSPDPRIGVLAAGWQVPLPWFVLFEPDERQLTLGSQPRTQHKRAQGSRARTGTARGLTFLTTMARARQRNARALHVVRRSFDDGPAVGALEDVGRWLEEFHPHSMVELDYGGLVHMLDDAALEDDDSVAALAGALSRLAAGDLDAAQGIYARVAGRWRGIAALENVN